MDGLQVRRFDGTSWQDARSCAEYAINSGLSLLDGAYSMLGRICGDLESGEGAASYAELNAVLLVLETARGEFAAAVRELYAGANSRIGNTD